MGSPSVTAVPDLMTAAAGNLANIRSTLSAATAAAAPYTTTVATAAADEVSAVISKLFGAYGQEFQALSAQASAFHAEFVNLLNGSAAAYLGTEIANAERTLSNAVNVPAQTLLGNGGAAARTLSHVAVPTADLGHVLNGIAQQSQRVGADVSTAVNGATNALLSNPVLPNATGSQLRSSAAAGAPGLQNELNRGLSGLFAPPAQAVAQNPYLALWNNTGANLAAIANTWSAHPFPLLTQIMINQQGYAALTAMHAQQVIAGFPGELQYLPAQFEGFAQAVLSWNPLLYLQWFGMNSAHDAQILSTGLANAIQSFQTTIPVANSDIGVANQEQGAGDYHTAVNYVARALVDLFISGFDTSHLQPDITGFPNALVSGPIFLEGPAADLLPIVGIPGHELQNFAGLFPAGSIGGHMAQNFANVIKTLTNADVSATVGLDIDLLNPLDTQVSMNANFGPVLQLGFALMGPPITAMDGVARAETAFAMSMQRGDVVGAAAAIVDTPAYVLDGLLNGQVILDLNLPVNQTVGPLTITVPAVVHLPFNGLLVAPQQATATVNVTVPIPLVGDVTVPYNLTVGGTEFGGLIPFLVNGLPQQLARSITPTT